MQLIWALKGFNTLYSPPLHVNSAKACQEEFPDVAAEVTEKFLALIS